MNGSSKDRPKRSTTVIARIFIGLSLAAVLLAACEGTTEELPTRAAVAVVPSATVSPTRGPAEETVVAALTAAGVSPTPTITSTPSATSRPRDTATPRPTATQGPPVPTRTSTPVPVTPTPTPSSTPTVTPTETRPPNVWLADYFNNRDLSGEPFLTRDDGQLAFNWGSSSPASGMPTDNFSVRWRRTVAFNAGTFRFLAFADDGIRVWLDGQIIVDEWHAAGNQFYIVERTLTAGDHTFLVEYYEGTGDAIVEFRWEDTGQYPDWRGEYFGNPNLAGGPAVTRNDANIQFNWGTGAPAAGFTVDNFSVRWTRTLGFNAGRYRFAARSDDGLRVWFDGTLIIDEWHDFTGDTVYETFRDVSAGVHTVRVEYYEAQGTALVEFIWERQ